MNKATWSKLDDENWEDTGKTTSFFIVVVVFLVFIYAGYSQEKKANDAFENAVKQIEERQESARQNAIAGVSGTYNIIYSSSADSNIPVQSVKLNYENQQKENELRDYCIKVRDHIYEWVDRDLYKKCIDIGVVR